jgi:hypothetical protein
MNSQLVDPSDSLQVFKSEASISPTRDSEPPTRDLEPAFLRAPTFGYAQEPIATLDNGRPSQSVRIWLVATVSVVVGVLGGFAAGYAIAYRVSAPIVASIPLPASPVVSQIARAEQSTDLKPAANAAPSLPTEPSAASAASTPPSTAAEPRTAALDSVRVKPSVDAPATPRGSRAANRAHTSNLESRVPPARRSSESDGGNPESRPSAADRRAPAVVPTTDHAGSIEIMSNPRGAQVFLDGNVIGLAPMSIANVSEGTHEVRLDLVGFKPWTASVRVGAGSRARIGASLEP